MKKNLAIVAHNINNRGGMEIHLSEIIKRTSEDYNITVIASELTGNFPNVKFIKIPVPQKPVFLKSVLFCCIVSLLLLFKKFDCVHTTGAIVFTKVNLSTVHFCHRAYNSLGLNDRLKHTKSFAHTINSWLQGNFALWMEGICYKPKRIPKLIAVSEHVKNELLEHFDYQNNEVDIIPNGVDIKTFSPPTELEKQDLKRRMGIKESELVFVFVGGDWSRKGLKILLEAFENLLERHSKLEARVLVVGKGNKQSILQGLSNQTVSRIIFQGFQENPAELYKMSDIYVLPSLYETFSIASLEAGACGLPIIMTPVGVADIIAIDDVTGYTIERTKESALAAMEKLSLNKMLRENMSQQVRLRSQTITWDETYALFNKQYQSLIS
ncbi:glycosyltransferase family 4 protein [Niallia taxi]|nr:glycosyltransferase family 4 protein [Niallia taxi]MDE5053919.1 glycosyltransferase family 4 protein [Niallia taxi]